MLDLTNIVSLTEFQRNAKAQIDELKKSGRPRVLTVNGRAELVVQDAQSYQRLLDLAELGRARTTPLVAGRLPEQLTPRLQAEQAVRAPEDAPDPIAAAMRELRRNFTGAIEVKGDRGQATRGRA